MPQAPLAAKGAVIFRGYESRMQKRNYHIYIYFRDSPSLFLLPGPTAVDTSTYFFELTTVESVG